MSEMTRQPMPTPNDSQPIAEMVIADIHSRMKVGFQTYGTFLQPFNGRDALQDLYEELLDAACYVKQAMIERDAKVSGTVEYVPYLYD